MGAAVARDDAVFAAVASAARLREGDAGVRAVLRAIGEHDKVSVRDLSRAVFLPVPVVAAVCNELRARGLVSRERPVQLTGAGRSLLATRRPDDALDLTRLLARIEAEVAGGPVARLELDQAHCTAATKLRRVLLLRESGALDGTTIVFVGDDDLTSISVAAVLHELGETADGPREIVVVDIDPAVLAFVSSKAGELGIALTAVHHDLRDPLPAAVSGRADVAFTDPPYTVAGGSLFLARACEALREGPGREVFVAFGAKDPAVIAGLQRAMLDVECVVHGLHRSFNEYDGASVLGSTSDLYHLRTLPPAAPVPTSQSAVGVAGRFDAPMYTGDNRMAPRRYHCTACDEAYLVGRDQTFTTVAVLQAATCTTCGNDRFRPAQLVHGDDAP